MRIWHDGSASSPATLGGVNATVWLLAREQARLGHRVTLLLQDAPDQHAVAWAAAHRIELLKLEPGALTCDTVKLAAAIDEGQPQVVHMHSVFIPRQLAIARELRRRGIPYIVTPHGGLAPVILRRNRIRKFIYSQFLERPRCRGAALVTVAPNEACDVREFLGAGGPRIVFAPVPVDSEAMGTRSWSGNVAQKRIVFLGRFDVHVKGIDVLVQAAAMMPEAKFDLYGTEDSKTLDQLRAIQSRCPANVAFHAPVLGDEKARVLREASMYLQLSRTESFGISIAEAMYLGVPCAISKSINMAKVFAEHDLGLTLGLQPAAIVASLRQALESPARLADWSRRAREYATGFYESSSAARKYLTLYEEVWAAARSHTLPIFPPGSSRPPRRHAA